MTTFDEYTELESEALWQDVIAMSELTVIAAAGSSGKTAMLMDLAARVSNGQDMPDGSPGGPPGDVILASVEDQVEARLVPLLNAYGADMSRIHNLGMVGDDDFLLPEHMPELYRLAGRAENLRLTILDPLAQVADCSLTAVRTVRKQIMRPLLQFTRKTGSAGVLAHHLNKDGSIAGSAAIVTAARSVLLMAREQNPDIRRITTVKTNVFSGRHAPLRFTVTDEGARSRVVWLAGAQTGPEAANGPAQARVLLLLSNSDTPRTPQDIARLTGLDYGVVRVILSKMKARGLVESPKRGLWTLAEAA
jgi:DNA repair protein RadA/Sms